MCETRSSRLEVSCKKGVFKNLENSQENTYFKPCNFIKKRLQHRCLPLKCPKFLRTPLCTEHPAACASKDASRDACKSLVDVWSWGKVQSGCFGWYVTVTLFSTERYY